MLIGLLLAFGLLTSPSPSRGQEIPAAERIAFTAYRNGQWDIYSIAPDGTRPKQLTRSQTEETDPAYSPDGTQLAFAARRNNNWDVYVLDLQSGVERRLTDSPHYDGAPSWSPDGQAIAYESYHSGNLDVWLIDANGNEPSTNLTAESEAGDFAPNWNPAGNSIVFTSWRRTPEEIQPAHKDLYLLDLTTGRTERLTAAPTAESEATWHPDGTRLAFSQDDLGDLEIFTMDVSNPAQAEATIKPVTWLGRTSGPVWSPDGNTIAAVYQRWDGEIITLTEVGAKHQLPLHLTGVINIQGRLTWHAQAIDFGVTVPSLIDPGLAPQLYEEQLGVKTGTYSRSTNMVRLNDVDVGTPWLADTVDDSFSAWRSRLRDEVGYDFLNRLSDATRAVSAYTETSQYASWHKSGRAVDTLFDYYLADRLATEIVREDYSGETFWRFYLRCADQSGRCGRPLTVNPWNYSERARTTIAPEQGGIEKTNISGYYVDFTALAREYGWWRISAYDDQDFSWTWHFTAFEYWHYQKRFGRNEPETWYQAMLDLYPPETLEEFFYWDKMQEIGDDPYLIALKGVPLPYEFRLWWANVQP